MLVIFLLVVGIGMMILEQHRSATIVYGIAFIFGPLSEALVIHFGAWSYAEPHIFNFPMWLPFVWGNAGLFLNRANVHVRLRF